METKNYPDENIYEAELSTVLPCAICGVPNRINEKMLVDDKANKVYHAACKNKPKTMENVEETKVYEMTIEENYPVKSEG